MADWYIIINPLAGSGKALRLWEKAKNRLEKMGVGYRYAVTEYSGHAVRLASCAAEEGYRNFLAVGGDGSVHEVYCGLMNTVNHFSLDPKDFTLGVLPIGSGNDWIKSMNIGRRLRDVIECIANNSRSLQDVVKVAGAGGHSSYMANIGGIGFDSLVCEKVNARKRERRGKKLMYAQTLLETITETSIIDVEVVADGVSIFKGGCYSISFGNGKYSGGGMRQTSKACNNDGLLDVMIVPVISMSRIAVELPRLYLGSLHKSKAVIYKQCRHLKVRPLTRESEVCYEVDGEVDGHLPMEVSMVGQSLGVISKNK